MTRKRPVLGFTASRDMVDLIDAFQKARGLTSRSAAINEMIRFAIGFNREKISVLDRLPSDSPRKRLMEELDFLHNKLLQKYENGEI